MARETECLEGIKGPRGEPFILHQHALTAAQRNALREVAEREGFEQFLVHLPNTMSLKRAISLPYRQNGELKLVKITPDGTLIE
jgi:hypothetical protein